MFDNYEQYYDDSITKPVVLPVGISSLALGYIDVFSNDPALDEV